MSAKREIRFEGAPSAKREVLPTHPKGADETDEREARNPLKGAPSAQRPARGAPDSPEVG